MPIGTFALGEARALHRPEAGGAFRLPPHHLLTHGVVVGMTGSGKTGLVTVLAEEALRAKVPVLVIDVKGDLPNLLLAFPSFDAGAFLPFVEGVRDPDDARTALERAEELARVRRSGLEGDGVTEGDLADYRDGIDLRLVTPGARSGESLHVLSSLERRPKTWDTDPERARESVHAAVSMLLRLLGREDEPTKSREHVLLAALAEARHARGEDADLAALLADVEEPPLDRIGAMAVDDYLPHAVRHEFATHLNSLLASPRLRALREGASLDLDDWLTPRGGRTPGVVLSVAHLDDDERMLVLGMVLRELLAWVRAQPGSQHLRALVLCDEVYGFLPPHPHNPPTKRPLVALMKQARAFGVGVVLATQNPMDLDYRALGNAGLWCLGRLQTDADRARVVEGLTGHRASDRGEGAALANTLKRLGRRWFIVRDAHDGGPPVLLRPRHTLSWLRGPMTREELRAALEADRVDRVRPEPTLTAPDAPPVARTDPDPSRGPIPAPRPDRARRARRHDGNTAGP